MISPISFITNPLLWLKLMSELKVTFSVSPNFGFRLVARKFMEMKKKDPSFGVDLDLSSLVMILNAAEPIQTDTKKMFDSTFAKFGLRKTWFMAGYGLAENVAAAIALNEFKL